MLEEPRQGATNYDIKLGGLLHDLTTKRGFFEALRLGFCLRRKAITIAGPPCSERLGPCLGFNYGVGSPERMASVISDAPSETHPLGNIRHKKVRLANLIVANTVVLLLRLHDRGCFFVLEQPARSWMFKIPCMRDALRQMGCQPDKRITTWMGAFGHPMPKCSHLIGTLPTLSWMRRSKKDSDRESCRDHKKVFLIHDSTGVSGGKDLPGSAAYTPDFCDSLYRAWEHAFQEPHVPEEATSPRRSASTRMMS